MCSVIDLIESQKHFIEIKRKTFESLNQFLDSIDKRVSQTNRSHINGLNKGSQQKAKPIETNGQQTNKKSVSSQEMKRSNDLMLKSNVLFGWLGSDKDEQRRKHLSEERRKEYNEFLEQKTKSDPKNQIRSTKRVTKVIPNYNQILHKKRNEEQKYRELNGFDEIEDMDIEEGLEQLVPTVGWFHCSNNKFDPEYITPRSRLLATHSSRVKAQQYREELKKQVQEKERLKAEERKRVHREEEEFDHKLDEQRMRLLREYEEEQRVRRKKNDQMKTKPEISKEIGSTSPVSLLRSPSYLPIKRVNPLSSKHKKRSLNSELFQSPKRIQSIATQTSVDPKPDLTSAELSDSELSSDVEEEDNKKQTKDVEYRDRVLSRLSEVRRMMERDHIKMMEQLKQQMDDE